MKTVLSRHLGDSPENVRLVIGPTDKPALAGNSTHFNLSHSGGVAIVAVASVPVGTDIEAIKLDMDHAGVADEIFSSSEVRRLNAVGAKAMAQAFFDIWTRKEAYLKATGLGFSADLKRISTATGDGTVHDQTQLSGASNWYSHELDLGEGFKAALVVVDGDPQIVVRHLAPDESMALRLSDGGWQPRQGA